jgi:hypothetical protein
MQGLGARSRRDLLRKTWVPQGKGLRDLEEEKSVVIRFVVGYRHVSCRPARICCIAMSPHMHESCFCTYVRVTAFHLCLEVPMIAGGLQLWVPLQLKQS